MRIDALDDFAVEFKHKSQNSMGGWMLGSKVDGEISERVGHHELFAFSSPGST